MPDTSVRVHPVTKDMMKARSLTHDANGKATESYDSIIRRGMAALERTEIKIDVSKI